MATNNPFEELDNLAAKQSPVKETNPFAELDAQSEPVVQVEKPTPVTSAPTVAAAFAGEQPNAQPVKLTSEQIADRVIPDYKLGENGLQGEAPGIASRFGRTLQRVSQSKQPVVKPAFDFTTGKTGALHDALVRSYQGSTQADLYAALANRLNLRQKFNAENAPMDEESDVRYAELEQKISNGGFFSLTRAEAREARSLAGRAYKYKIDEHINGLKDLIRVTNAKIAQANGTTQGMADFNAAKGFKNASGELVSNLIPIMAEGATGSAIGTLKGAVAAAAASAAVVGSGGTALLAQGAGLAAAGVSSGVMSYNANLLEKLTKWGEANGVDILEDVDGWTKAAMTNPENFDQEYYRMQGEAGFESAVEGAAVTGLGGAMHAIPGGERWISRFLIGRGKEAFEEAGTTLATNWAKGDLGSSQDYLLSAALGFGMGNTEGAVAKSIAANAQGGSNQAPIQTAPIPAAPTPAPTAAAPVDPVAPTPVAPAAPAAPIAGEVVPTAPAPVAPVAPAAEATPAVAPASAPSVDPTIALQEQLNAANEVLSAYEAEKAKAEFEVEAANAALKDDPENAEKLAAARDAQATLDGKNAGFDAATDQVRDITAQLEAAPSPVAAPAPAAVPATQAKDPAREALALSLIHI
jgi:hypothetical protein